MIRVGAGVSSENWEPGSRSVIKIDCVKLAALDLAMLLWCRDHKMAAFTLISSLKTLASIFSILASTFSTIFKPLD